MNTQACQYATPDVPAGWAEEHRVHEAIAMAAFAICTEERTPEAICAEPTPAEQDHVAMAVQEYLRCGVVTLGEDAVALQWGDDCMEI